MSGGHSRPSSGLAWAVLVVAAALIGGLAAAALVHVSLAVAVPVSVVAGAIAAFAAARWPAPANPAPANPAPADPEPAYRPEPARPEPARRPEPGLHRRPGASEPVVQLLPASPGRQEWWDAAQGAAPPAPSPAGMRAPAPDLSSYLASTVIAQCPNCGAFRLDFRRARSGWDIRCESCRHAWTWQPGAPWPPVRVAPTRRTQLSRNRSRSRSNERHT